MTLLLNGIFSEGVNLVTITLPESPFLFSYIAVRRDYKMYCDSSAPVHMPLNVWSLFLSQVWKLKRLN